MRRLLGLLIVSLFLGIPAATETEKTDSEVKQGTHPPVDKQLFRKLPVPVQQGQSGQTLRQAERLQPSGGCVTALPTSTMSARRWLMNTGRDRRSGEKGKKR